MDKPTECRWCGCGEVMSDCEALKHFQCGSGYWSGNNHWHRGTNCTDNRDARLTDLMDRIQRAVEVLEGATRYCGDLVENDQYGEYMQGGTNSGWFDVIEVEQAIEILKGVGNGKTD